MDVLQPAGDDVGVVESGVDDATATRHGAVIGDHEVIARVLRKMLAVRVYKRRQGPDGTVDDATVDLLSSAGTDPVGAEAIYRLTTLPTIDERFVLPPYHREMSIESLEDPLARKGAAGVGYLDPPKRGW